ncbi:MAG: hypothetical protein ACH34X_11095 [Thiolinea sp.]
MMMLYPVRNVTLKRAEQLTGRDASYIRRANELCLKHLKKSILVKASWIDEDGIKRESSPLVNLPTLDEWHERQLLVNNSSTEELGAVGKGKRSPEPLV